MDFGFGEIIVVLFTGGIIAGMIAYSRLGGAGTFIGFFLLGACFPIIGIIAACLARPHLAAPAPQPPGWYPDPWRQARLRWWDGYQWSWHLG